MAQLQEIFQSFQCKICMNEYNSTYMPRIVCTNDHILCTICAKIIPGYLCPYCKQRMRYNDDYKQLFKIKEATHKILDRQKKFQDNISSLERMVEKLGVENEQLIKDKQKVRYYIESNQFCFKMAQIPKQDDSFEKKFAFLTDKVKEGMEIINQKAKKITNLKDQQSKTQTKLKELEKKLSIQQQVSQRLYKDLEEMQGHMQLLERQVQTMNEQVQRLLQVRDQMMLIIMRLQDKDKQSLKEMTNLMKFYEQKLRITKYAQDKMVEQFTLKCDDLEQKNKDHTLQKQALCAQILLLNRKIERQREYYNSKYEYFLQEKQSAQQSMSILKTNMEDVESNLKDQIQTLKKQKLELTMYKERLMAESKDIQEVLQSVIRQNQSLKERVMLNKDTIAKLQDEKLCLSRQKEQMEEKYLAELRLLKTHVVQPNKDFDERSDRTTKVVVSEKTQLNQTAQVEKQQQERHALVIQKYQSTQRQLQNKILQLEKSLQYKVNQNHSLQEHLKTEHNTSLGIRQGLINKVLVLNDKIDQLSRQNQKLTKKLDKCNLTIPQDTPQLVSSFKRKFSAIRQAKFQSQKALSSINQTNVTKIDECNKQIQKISGNSNELKANYEKCLDIITQINSIQQENNTTKSFPKLSTTKKDKETPDVCPNKFGKHLSCELSNQNQNNTNFTNEQHSKQSIRSQDLTVSKQRTQIKLPAQIYDNLHKLEISRRVSKSQHSIKSIIQSQKEAIKTKMIG